MWKMNLFRNFLRGKAVRNHGRLHEVLYGNPVNPGYCC